MQDHQRAEIQVAAEFMKVDGNKEYKPVSEKRREFLEAVQKVIDEMEDFHPLSIRQIHYRLLNDPPLKQTPKRSTKTAEHYRYRNDSGSYNSLVDLLTIARYTGAVSMSCIDDPTRPQRKWQTWDSVSGFVEEQIHDFLKGFHRNRQLDQPRHIEVFAEKNTLFQILMNVCPYYHVPFSIGRGFCSIPVWRDMAQRFRASGKQAMSLIIVSDYDYAGLELADDALRSLALHGVYADGHRVAVTPEQIEELDLADDFNPAKEDGKKLASFVERTGDSKTWECEALPPDYLVEQIKAAIEAKHGHGHIRHGLSAGTEGRQGTVQDSGENSQPIAVLSENARQAGELQEGDLMGRGLSTLQRVILRLALESQSRTVPEEVRASAEHWGVPVPTRVGRDVYYSDVLITCYGFTPKVLPTGYRQHSLNNGRVRHGGTPPTQIFDVKRLGKKYNAAMVAVSRAFASLERRGLLTVQHKRRYGRHVGGDLTELGAKVAVGLSDKKCATDSTCEHLPQSVRVA